MEEILTRPVDVDDKLQKEVDKLSSLKDALGRSSQLTDNMLTIVTSFENRLSRLEETITPVYLETGNLQRRHENIEKTLGALDNVLEYYHVAEEVEPAIREGPGAGLESYIGSMQRLQKAVEFFNKNNPDSPEMAQVTTLYESGKDTLEREFKNTLSRHSKPVPAVLLLDILAIDDELPNEQPQQIEHLPNKVKTDLMSIANWLLRCGYNTDYMQAYSQVRSSILLKSLQTLKDHLKTGSKDSASLNQMLHSPALIGKGKPGRDTPSKRAMKRMAFVRKASTALMKQSIAQLEAAGLKRASTSTSELRCAEDSIEVDIDFYITGVSALLKLIKSELILMEGIVPVKHQHKVFDNLIQAALDSVKKEGEQISSNIRRAIGRGNQHTAVLAIFPVLRHLRAIRPEFATVLEGCSPTTKSRLTNLIGTLDSTGAKALEEFVDSVRNDPNKQTNMPTDGTVHELTSNTIVFLQQLLEFEETAGAMLLTQDPSAVEGSDQSQRKLAEYITKVLSSLGLNLNNKCETYNDVTLKSIFMLNNYNYILKSLKRTGMLDVVRNSQPQVEEFYDEQILEQKRLYSQRTRMLGLVHGIDGDIETHYNTQIGQLKKQYQQSWSKVLHYIMEASNPMSHNRLSVSPENKLKDKDRQAIKDKFSGFNKEMEEIYRIQKAYAIPDSELRENLKNDNKEFIVPQYQMFREKYKNVNFTKNPEKYIKHTVADIGRFIDKFFDAAA